MGGGANAGDGQESPVATHGDMACILSHVPRGTCLFLLLWRTWHLPGELR